MSKIKITQVKSHIDRPQRQKDTIKALGLGKINRSKIVETSPSVQGMVNSVAHMLKIENIKD
ncbi:MAG: 50S ribosomal protein L30 [Bacteroidota bacterium]|nr:50S ribosomal protein L30 [Bacteroidota bacterium]